MEEKKYIKRFRAKKDYKAQHNEKFINIEKGKIYDKIDIFWEPSLLTEKVILEQEIKKERSK